MSNPSTLARIFTRPGISSQISQVHSDIIKSQSTYYNSLSISDPLLLDALVCPVSRNLNIVRLVHEKVKTMLMQDKEPDFSVLGIYNMPEICSVMLSRWRFVQALKAVGEQEILTRHPLKLQDLCDISRYAPSHTVLLAIKYYYLYLSSVDERFTEEKYLGLPAMTDPVKKACKILWGSEFRDMLQAKKFTTQLAQETGLNELQINTGLWLLGQEMRA